MTKKEQAFIKTVWQFFHAHGRQALPWRKTKDPYRILVSEVMLQQTQVDRVIPKYRSFLKTFPTVRALARAPLGAVLREWQGLGYNRRAQLLKRAAAEVVVKHRGVFPRTHEALMGLPGVGPYTAGAVLAFAFNTGLPIIETNIRTAYLHHFFSDATDVDDREIQALVTRTLDRERPRDWYYALMDYGAYLKKKFGNPNSRSKHYTRQSAFKGSDRQIRGMILRLLACTRMTRQALHAAIPFDSARTDAQLERLTEEALIEKRGRYYEL